MFCQSMVRIAWQFSIYVVSQTFGSCSPCWTYYTRHLNSTVQLVSFFHDTRCHLSQFVTRESTKALCQCCVARPSRTRVFSLSWMQSATTCHLLWTYHPPRQARGNRSIWIHLVRRFHPAKVKFHPAKLGNPRVYLRWWLQKTDSKRRRYARVTRHARAQGKNPKNDEEELIRETSPDEKLGFSCGRL